MTLKQVLEIPDYAVEWVEQVWDGKMRSGELEQSLDLIKWAREMGIIVNQTPGKKYLKIMEVEA